MIPTKRRISSPIKSYPYHEVLEFDKIYEGFVIDRIDEDGAGKIKVYIPELMNEQVDWSNPDSIPGIWVRVVRQHVFQFITPQINQWVLIKFLYGDPTFPIYLGTVPSEEEAPLDTFFKVKFQDEGSLPNLFDDVKPYYSLPEKSAVFKLTDEEIQKLPDFYVLYYGSHLHYRFVFHDDEEYNYSEWMSTKGYGLQLCDKNRSALFRSSYYNHILLYDNVDNETSKIELRTSTGSALELDQAQRTVYLHGHNFEMFGYTDKNEIVLTNTGYYKTKEIEVGSCKKSVLDSRICKVNSGDITKDDLGTMTAFDGMNRKIVLKNDRLFIEAGEANIVLMDNAEIYVFTGDAMIVLGLDGTTVIKQGSSCIRMENGEIHLNPDEGCDDIQPPEFEDGTAPDQSGGNSEGGEDTGGSGEITPPPPPPLD